MVPQAAPAAHSAVPKPFKKRYLAEQSVIVTSSHNQGAAALGHSASPSPNSTTPTPSATPTPPVSPMASDTVRACEALLELGRPLEEAGGPKEEVQRNGSGGYPPSGLKNGDHLRQAVWKNVVGTLLSQQVGSLHVGTGTIIPTHSSSSCYSFLGKLANAFSLRCFLSVCPILETYDKRGGYGWGGGWTRLCS